MKVLAAVLALAGVAAANSAFRFSDGYLDVLGAEPVQAFDCAGRSYGYYADVSSDCRVFHVCLPVADDLGELLETAHFSFFCGNQTVFSQESLTCAHPEEAFPATRPRPSSTSVNALFGYSVMNVELERKVYKGRERFVGIILSPDTDTEQPVSARNKVIVASA
ncbi:uncharacterized protein LOC134775826 [Penaeus indicus]|uniref:uncharacterized protein LOC134775826 n=1 Tax=Penaeus indicus TaxID=29960 RepID=UPI00300CD178